MTAESSARSAVEFALAHERDVDIIAGVKAAVIDELKRLDLSAEIHSTDYFNHTFVPDLVVKWRDEGKATERGVYLRFSLTAAALGGDVGALAEAGPIVLSLRENADSSTRDDIRHEVSGTDRVLVTDVSALDEAAAVRPSLLSSPLLALARSNIVRGARGLLEVETVNDLISVSLANDDNEVQSSNLDRFSDLVQDIFVSDAAVRLRRASDLIRFGEQRNLIDFDHDINSSRLVRGSLSDAELRVLLPYLLSRSEITRSRDYWSYVGSLMDLKRLESLADEFDGIDLDPLIDANISNWFGLRSALAITADEEMQNSAGTRRHEDAGEIADVPSAGWRMRSGMLSLNIGQWRLYVASSGNRLRGQLDSPSASWEDLRPALENFELAGVALMGVVRRVDVAAEQDADVRADIATISESLEDSFYVPSAAVWESGEQGRVVVDIDFKKMLAVARKKVSIGGLARIAVGLLGYRHPVASEELARFSRTDE